MADLKISQFFPGGAVQTGDEIATNRAGVNTKVHVGSAAAADIGTGPTDIPTNDDLGSAAYEDVGTGIGEIPALEDVSGNPGLPAVDGSQLTNLPVQKDPTVKTTTNDTTAGFLDAKLKTETSEFTREVENPAGNEDLKLSIRKNVLTASQGSGTRNVNISDAVLHKLTATATFTMSATMAIGQALQVRAIAFNTYPPLFSGIDWGTIGAPAWTAKDDFMIYRDVDGNYNATLLVRGVT